MAAEHLVAARESLERVIATQTAAWESAGCPPTLSVDGESYDWNNWLATKLADLEKLDKRIQARSGNPAFIVRSRSRT